MKLTNAMRNAFVVSVMGDVPEVDYQDQAIKVYTAAHIALLPAEVQAMWNDPKLRDYLDLHPSYVSYTCVYLPGRVNSNHIPADVTAKIDRLTSRHQEQKKARKALEEKLGGVAHACTTVKALKEALPEFEKYMPSETAPTKNLPALANVVSDFVKAGWPRSKTQAVTS